MIRLLVLVLLVFAIPAWARPPRLTLFIAVDSMSSDVLLRMRPRLKSGLGQMLAQGAYFPTARYGYVPTVTAAGHATLATGANPWRHGVISNRVLNRATGREEPVFSDPQHPALEAPLTAGDVSPEALLAETLSDRLRLFTQERGKSIAISGKARSAIAMAGRLGQAYWFNESVGKLITGTFYAKEFPAWVKAFNDRNLPQAHFAKEWALAAPAASYVGEDDRAFEADELGLGRTFPHRLNGGLSSPGPESNEALAASPLMLDLLVQMAKSAIEAEALGKDEHPDLLSISFSPVDRIYHLYGPYSWEVGSPGTELEFAL